CKPPHRYQPVALSFSLEDNEDLLADDTVDVAKEVATLPVSAPPHGNVRGMGNASTSTAAAHRIPAPVGYSTRLGPAPSPVATAARLGDTETDAEAGDAVTPVARTPRGAVPMPATGDKQSDGKHD